LIPRWLLPAGMQEHPHLSGSIHAKALRLTASCPTYKLAHEAHLIMQSLGGLRPATRAPPFFCYDPVCNTTLRRSTALTSLQNPPSLWRDSVLSTHHPLSVTSKYACWIFYDSLREQLMGRALPIYHSLGMWNRSLPCVFFFQPFNQYTHSPLLARSQSTSATK